MPNPLRTTKSEPISEVKKVNTITNPVGQKDVAGTQIDPASMAGAPTLYNITLTIANTEYSQALPANTKKFTVQIRDGTSFRLAFVTGKVATPTEPYLSIGANSAYWEDNIQPSTLTLYLACGSADKTAEIVCWS